MASFYVENFGCRATQADGAAIECQFRERGLERAGAPAEAEIVVLNTCTVTAAADQDARAAIRRIQRENPGCQIVVTGCYAQRVPAEIAALPGVTQVIGNSHKHALAEIALAKRGRPGGDAPSYLDAERPNRENNTQFVPLSHLTTDDCIFVSDIFAHSELLAAPVFEAASERARPNLKVQDGCDNRCSFCVIPYVRGQSRSLPLDQVLGEVTALVDAGYREVVISGINLGRWGRDLGSGVKAQLLADCGGTTTIVPSPQSAQRLRFEDLIRAILSETSLEKLRISSVEPMDWTDQLIRLMAESPRIAKHAHVPMQSGSDRVLRLMHRKYRPWHYREKIRKIRAAMPTAAIGADVMTGFPGEAHGDFEETRRMVEELPFTYLHVFTYSPRPGTAAAAMRNQVPLPLARERNRILRELAAEKKLAFLRSFIGQRVEATTLHSPHCLPFRTEPVDGLAHPSGRVGESAVFTEALTDNYLKLRLHGRHAANRWIRARVEQVDGEVLIGVAS